MGDTFATTSFETSLARCGAGTDLVQLRTRRGPRTRPHALGTGVIAFHREELRWQRNMLMPSCACKCLSLPWGTDAVKLLLLNCAIYDPDLICSAGQRVRSEWGAIAMKGKQGNGIHIGAEEEINTTLTCC